MKSIYPHLKRFTLALSISIITLSIFSCGPSKEELSKDEKASSDSIAMADSLAFAMESYNKLWVNQSFGDTMAALYVDPSLSTELKSQGEDVTAISKDFKYPNGFTSYFNNKDAFKQNLQTAPGYIVKMVSVDSANSSVYFEPMRSAQAATAKISAKIPEFVTATSRSYNKKSKSFISFVLGNGGFETVDAYNFTVKEDIYASINNEKTDFDQEIINAVWNAEDETERSNLFIIREAYVVSYVTAKYKERKLNVAGAIPDQGGAIKIGTDIYVGTNQRDVIYKAKIVAVPLKNYITNTKPAKNDG